MMLQRLTGGLLALVLFFGSAGTATADLIVNGGFETGTTSGWTKGGYQYFYVESLGTSARYVQSGEYGLRFGGYQTDSTLSQTVATTIGAEYQLSYWVYSDGGNHNDFSVTFGGQTLFSETGLSAFGYTEYTFDAVATSTLSTLTFAARDDAGSGFGLDNVSLTQMAAVPEPNSMAFMGLGLASIAIWRRRRGTTGAAT